jgi:hypothetical protein
MVVSRHTTTAQRLIPLQALVLYNANVVVFRENARSNASVVDFYEEDNGCSLSVRLHKKITRKHSIGYVIAKYTSGLCALGRVLVLT